jgi:hypothetical protein
MIVTRPVIEASVGGLMAVAILLSNAADIVQQTVTGPSVIFGVDTVWQWGLVLAAGAIVWRAAKLVGSVEAALARFADKLDTHSATQARVDADLLVRIEAGEVKWREWEPVLIEMRVRHIDHRDRGL